jgi:hypothetical protein
MLVVGCQPRLPLPAVKMSAEAPPTVLIEGAPSLWVSPGAPDTLRLTAESSGLAVATDAEHASIVLGASGSQEGAGSEWFYALVAPFPTVLDGVSGDELRDVWNGSSNSAFALWPLWMSSSTLALLSGLWGEPAAQVRTAEPDELLDVAWNALPSWAIIPFESVEPRWKVLSIDGQSPVQQDMDASAYPLRFRFTLTGPGIEGRILQLPSTNRDSSKLTAVMLTGTSALVREIAYQMEVKGITYPAQGIGDWLRSADILHVSHETSFDPSCPVPNPLKPRFFCSSPRYIGLFDDVGVDVVELTGNHILDNGAASMLYTLDLYREHGISYYGGGANLEDARAPLLIEHHGNKLAFLGCNFAEPPQPLATSRLPGANPCEWALLERQISQVRAEGYLPIVTMQYKEGYSPMVMPWQSVDFHRPAAAGAVIVSGSQSHVPLQMEFFDGAIIHYGLGNLFFGQMGNQPPGPGLPLQPAVRYEFLDRHIIYAGRHISTELLTALLEDYAQPRPMTTAEREEILQAYFGYSGWLPLIPTPAPVQTPTLFPFLKFAPLPTYTPFPTASALP